jgi:tetratricopeptide (TPR) repeat protein
MRCILHIGLHKTGSTAIQQFSYSNRDYLLHECYKYLDLYYQHSLLIGHLYSDNPYKNPYNEIISSEYKIKITHDDFISYLDENKDNNLIISGEGISVFLEEELERLKRDLYKFYDEVIVVIYVREPYSWLNSNFCQHVKNGITLDTFNKDVLHYFDFKSRIKAFINVFSKENIICRKYSKQILSNNDVVIDFYNLLGVDIRERYSDKKINVKLSSEVINILDLVNTNLNVESSNPDKVETVSLFLKFVSLLDGIGRTRHHFDFLTPKFVYEYFKEDLEWLEKEFMITFDRPEFFGGEELDAVKLKTIGKIASLLIGFIKSHKIEDKSFFDNVKKWSEEINDGLKLSENFYYIMAQWAFKFNYYDKSSEMLQECISLHGGTADLYTKLAESYNKLGRHDAALTTVHKAICLGSEEGGAYLLLGDLLREKHDLPEAIEAYKSAIEFDPDLIKPHIQLSLIYDQFGDYDLALDEVRQAIALDSQKSFFHLHLGRLLKKKSDLSGALKAFDAAVRLDPLSAAPFFQLSLANEEFGNVDLALEQVRSAISIESDNSYFYMHLGRLLKKASDLTGAKCAFEKAVEFNPALAGPHFQLSLVCEELGEIDYALSEAEKAVAATPDNNYFNDRLGKLLKQAAAN